MPNMSRIARMRQAKSRRRRKNKDNKKQDSELQEGNNGMKFNVAEIAKMLEQMPSKQRKKAMKKIKKSADSLGLDALLKLQGKKQHDPGCECCVNEIFEKAKEMCEQIPTEPSTLETVELDSDGEIPDLVPMSPEKTKPVPKMSGPNNDALLKFLKQNKNEEEEEPEQEEKVEVKIVSPKKMEAPKNDILLQLLKTEQEQREIKKVFDQRPNPPLTALDILKENDMQLPSIVEETFSETQDSSKNSLLSHKKKTLAVHNRETFGSSPTVMQSFSVSKTLNYTDD